MSETLSGVTLLKIWDISLMCGHRYVILYFDPPFLCLLRGVPLPLPPLNRIFRFSDPVSFKEINCLPLRIRLFLNDTCRT